MKKLSTLLFAILVFSCVSSFVAKDNVKQKTFKIIQKDTKFSNEFCEKAILDASWCGFRYENKRNIIQFETGLKVEFYSMKEIGDSNPNCILTDYRDFSKDVWCFSENGKVFHFVSKPNIK